MTAAELAYKTSATGATEADDLVLQELPQVYYIAARIRERLPQHVEMEDLVSAGVIGLLEATRSFDGSKNVQFQGPLPSFGFAARSWTACAKTDWGSRYMRRRGREIADVTARLEARLGRHPVESEIAEEMHLEPEHLRRLIAQLDSLQIAGQKVAVANDRSESLDVIESAPNLDDPDPFEICLEGEMKAHLAEAISKTQRERAIDSVSLLSRRTHDEGIGKGGWGGAFARFTNTAGNDGQTQSAS